MAQETDNLHTVSCSLLGEQINLRCTKEQKASLIKSLDTLKDKASMILRSNPNLNPTQAAILVALDCQNALNNYLENETPFTKEAQKFISKMQTSLKKVQND